MLPPLRIAVSVSVAMVSRVVTAVTGAMGSRTGATVRGGWPDVVARGTA